MIPNGHLPVGSRPCPDLGEADDERPLVQQHIHIDTCHRRQARGYHKCHRCVYHELERVNACLDRIEVLERA